MQIFYILSYVILAGFFLLELFARREKGENTLRRTKFDRGSSTTIWALITVTIILILNAANNAYLRIDGVWGFALGIVGIVVGLIGLITRYVAFRTLGRFFTKILRKTENHTLVTNGIYRYIRHPGYLGNILIFWGAALCMGNFIPIIFVPLAFTPVYLYRIHTEEKMLMDIFGDEYRAYKQHSKRLIPFIY